MKTKLPCSLLLAIFTFLKVQAQAPDIAWQQTFGGDGNDIMQDISQTDDGNFILLGLDSISGGDITCVTQGKHDTWVIKMDPVGNIIWQQCFGGTKEEGNPNSQIIQTSDKGYLFETETWSNDGDVVGHHKLSDAWTVKLDSMGNIQWAKSFGGINWDVPRRILELPGHRYVIVSRSTSQDGDVPPNIDTVTFDAWVFIVDANGNIIHNNIYGGTGNDDLYDVHLLPDGTLKLFGLTSSHDGTLAGLTVDSTDAWVLNIDTNGNILSNRVYSYPNGQDIIQAIGTDDGGFVCFGESEDLGITPDHGSYHGNDDYWIFKLDSAGNIEWNSLFGGSDKEQLRAAATVPNNGGYYLTGTTLSDDGDVSAQYNGKNWWVISVGNDGSLLWTKTIGGSESDYSYSMVDQGIIVGGTYSNDGDQQAGLDGNADGWVLQLDVATAAHQLNGVKGQIVVSPVPVNYSMRIQTEGLTGNQQVEVRDLLGRVLLNQEENDDDFQIDVSRLQPGFYLLTVQSEDASVPACVSSFEVAR